MVLSGLRYGKVWWTFPTDHRGGLCRNTKGKRTCSPTCPTNRSSVRPTDHPSNRESARPTVRPVLLRRKSCIVLRARIRALFKAHTKVAAFGRHHKRGGAAFGCATSFVVSFVLALNRADIVAVNAILVLHVGTTGRRTGGRSPLG